MDASEPVCSEQLVVSAASCRLLIVYSQPESFLPLIHLLTSRPVETVQIVPLSSSFTSHFWYTFSRFGTTTFISSLRASRNRLPRLLHPISSGSA